jgi:tetratricopeptide (TPR) repeat protein
MRRSRSRTLSRLVALLVLGQLVAHAWGQAALPPTMNPEARELLERAVRYYETQEYEQAIDALKQGYQLDPQPAFLYTLGQAERSRGNCARAIEAYRSFLRTHPPEKQAQLAHVNIERCTEELKHPAAPPPAPSTTPASSPSIPTTKPSLLLSPSRARRWPAWVLIGTGVAVAVAGGAVYGTARRRFDELKASCDGVCAPQSWQSWSSATDASYALLAIGGAALVGGIIWMALPSRKQSQHAAGSASMATGSLAVEF